MSTVILRAEEVSRSFGPTVALRHASVQVAVGEAHRSIEKDALQGPPRFECAVGVTQVDAGEFLVPAQTVPHGVVVD
jgi:ABC-type branched-subunit amino acid transport system ATPase component